MLLFGSFGSVQASAASENLIDSDLTKWTLCDPTETTGTAVVKKGNIYRIRCTSNGSYAGGYIYELADISVGDSLTLSFKMPTASECAAAFDTTFTHAQLLSNFEDSSVFICYGYMDSDGFVHSVNELYTITSDNADSFVGKTLSTSFIATAVSGTPCIAIQVSSFRTNFAQYFFSNFGLYNNNSTLEAVENLDSKVDDVQDSVFSLSENFEVFRTGLASLLHDFKWELIGGECGDSECSKNPHIGLAEKFRETMSSLGNTITDFFHDLRWDFTGGQCGKSECEKNPHVGLGDRIKGFFSDSDENTSNNFFNIDNSIGGYFNNIGESISTWFNEQIETLRTNFNELMNTFETGVSDIRNTFNSFIDKWKPRFQFNLHWRRGIIPDIDTGELIFGDDYYVSTSDMFLVPSGSAYKLNYISSNDYIFAIFKYTSNGEYIGFSAYDSSLSDFSLDSGYQYIFTVADEGYFEDTDAINDVVVIYADEGWINAFFYNLKLSFTSAFVPTQTDIDVFKDEIDTTMSEHLGIVYTSFDFFHDFMTTIQNILSDNSNELVFEFPEIAFDLSLPQYRDGSVVWRTITFRLIDSKTVNMEFLQTNSTFNMFYSMYEVILIVILSFALFSYAYDTFDRRIH